MVLLMELSRRKRPQEVMPTARNGLDLNIFYIVLQVPLVPFKMM